MFVQNSQNNASQMNNTENTKTVLIIGADGFLGLNSVKTFIENGYFVYAVVNDRIPKYLSDSINVEILNMNFKDKNSYKCLKTLNLDSIIHIPKDEFEPKDDEEAEKVHFKNLKKFSKVPFKNKFIHISSVDVCGLKDFINGDENSSYEEKPLNLHQKYKIKAEKHIRKKLENHIILRTGILRDKNYSTIEQKVRKFLKLSPYIIHFGKWNGANRLLFSDVKNISNVILACVISDNLKNKVINVSDKKFTSVDEYYSEIALKYFPKKRFKRLYLPLFAGKLAGRVSAFIRKCLDLKQPLFEPTLYFLSLVSSNMDFSNKKCDELLDDAKFRNTVHL